MALTREDIWWHLDGLTKPSRSLGRLEELALWLCEVQQTLQPETTPRRLLLFAADHGVVQAGVTAWPASVTGLMIRNMCGGGAASTVFARQFGADVTIYDVGSNEPQTGVESQPGIELHDCRVRAGTRNLAEEPALTVEEFRRAWEIGVAAARRAASEDVRVVLVGEMGIGNTTSTACLAMLLADVSLNDAVGRGAGADDETWARKRAVVKHAVERAQGLMLAYPMDDIVAPMASVAGLEIVAMAGCFAEAHAKGLTIVLDGAVATAAALIANVQSPGVSGSMIAAHLSAEPSHAAALAKLQLTPFLDWNMRLGEGTGALLLLPLLDAAAAMTKGMATLESFGVPPRTRS
jgi:nicotinate-nucleotide--dimethylbenzimidazole phosphoribosyltransferase